LGQIVGSFHQKLVFGRRTRVLADHIADMLPPGARVLDIGCGDGTIDRLVKQRRPDVTIEGTDVLVRPATHIPVKLFDGTQIPHPDRSFDVAAFVDVLHHTADPLVLLREAVRVGKIILIKDHFRAGLAAKARLRFMDWVGNAHHGVALPYNYWTQVQWASAFDQLGFRTIEMRVSLGLYPPPASWIFGGRLHFMATFCCGRSQGRSESVPGRARSRGSAGS
jgi:SAM-dependent methyltransferase